MFVGDESVTVNMGGVAYKLPLGPDGKVIAPGAPAAVEQGCTCDPEKNNYGRGVSSQESGAVRVIIKDGCPVHPKVDPPGGWAVKG